MGSELRRVEQSMKPKNSIQPEWTASNLVPRAFPLLGDEVETASIVNAHTQIH